MSTVKDLKKLAKETGLRGYSKLRKDELLSLLERPIPAPRRDFSQRPIPAPRRNFSQRPIPTPRRDFSQRPTPAPRRDFSERPIPATRNILNIPNPEINVPVLQPEIAVVKKDKAPSFIEETTETVLGWMNWLAESGENIVKAIPPKLNNLKEKINKIFEEKKRKRV